MLRTLLCVGQEVYQFGADGARRVPRHVGCFGQAVLTDHCPVDVDSQNLLAAQVAGGVLCNQPLVVPDAIVPLLEFLAEDAVLLTIEASAFQPLDFSGGRKTEVPMSDSVPSRSCVTTSDRGPSLGVPQVRGRSSR